MKTTASNQPETAIDFDQALQAAEAESAAAIALTTAAGLTVDLSQWITIKRYVEKYSLASTHIVTNWIRRGVIPADAVMTLPELNDLRLIKDQVYRD
ncbi:hypothetical protein A6C57_00445 [Fibrella sp. ES10-3-2-2]|nr:hypothetical protein A6C57_00445 [Fibrella sp. ES10-3-2-2]